MALDFHHGHGSPFSWRVWLALEHMALAYEVRVLSFDNGDTKKPQFVAINPRGQVPTLVDDGFALWESLAILEYLDERFTSGKKLYPGDAQERARIRRLSLEASDYITNAAIDPIVEELFYKKDAASDMERVGKCRDQLRTELEYFAGELRGDFLSGDSPTAADYVLYPSVGYAKRITFRKPESRLAEVVPPKIEAWAKRIEALPYFDKTVPAHWKK